MHIQTPPSIWLRVPDNVMKSATLCLISTAILSDIYERDMTLASHGEARSTAGHVQWARHILAGRARVADTHSAFPGR